MVEAIQYSANSLDPKEAPIIEELLKDKKLVVADVDVTLVDISLGHRLGVVGVKATLGSELGEKFAQIFQMIFEGKRHPNPQYFQLLDRIARLQRVDKDQIRVWSKETMIMLAASDSGVQLDANQIMAGRDAYWKGRRDGSKIYDDALPFIAKIEELGLPFVLMTDSYHIMQVNPDLSLVYIPEESEAYKRRVLSDILDFRFTELVIGDPIGKPDPRFFKKVFGRFRDQPEKILVVGDSEANDLSVPRIWGCPTLLIERNL